MVNSVRYGHPGFVCDAYLSAITAETTLTAMELVAAGVWERRAGGYRVLDDDMVRRVIHQGGQTGRLPHACEDR